MQAAAMAMEATGLQILTLVSPNYPQKILSWNLYVFPDQCIGNKFVAFLFLPFRSILTTLCSGNGVLVCVSHDILTALVVKPV